MNALTDVRAHDPHDLDALDSNLGKAEAALLTGLEHIKVARLRGEALRQTRVRAVPVGTEASAVSRENPHGLFIGLHETDVIASAFASWFRFGKYHQKLQRKGIVGAAHSVEAWPNGMGWEPGMDRHDWPEWTKVFADHEIVLRPGGLDIVFLGVQLDEPWPPDLTDGDRVALLGYPAGVTVPENFEVRIGTARWERDEGDGKTWIIYFDGGERIVMGGMSGGVVLLLDPGQTEVTGRETAVATIVTQNGRLDGRHSADVTEIRDAIRKCRTHGLIDSQGRLVAA